jgi:hypothetical protein
MSELHPTRKRLLDALAGLSKEQWNFQPAAELLAHRAAGLLDGYQWILLMAGHTERHVLQIEEVKRQPGFPRGK